MSMIQIGDAFFERAEISAILPKAGETLVFLRSGKSVALDVILSADDIAELLDVTDS